MEIEFEVVPSHAEEVMEASDFIPDLCEANARTKAEPIAELHPECLVCRFENNIYQVMDLQLFLLWNQTIQV